MSAMVLPPFADLSGHSCGAPSQAAPCFGVSKADVAPDHGKLSAWAADPILMTMRMAVRAWWIPLENVLRCSWAYNSLAAQGDAVHCLRPDVYLMINITWKCSDV